MNGMSHLPCLSAADNANKRIVSKLCTEIDTMIAQVRLLDTFFNPAFTGTAKKILIIFHEQMAKVEQPMEGVEQPMAAQKESRVVHYPVLETPVRFERLVPFAF